MSDETILEVLSLGRSKPDFITSLLNFGAWPIKIFTFFVSIQRRDFLFGRSGLNLIGRLRAMIRKGDITRFLFQSRSGESM